MAISELKTPWRSMLRLASYKNAQFHCETNSREAGRRIVEHEFPKKELPYAEDMGHRSQTFSLRGYCITYVRDINGNDLFRRNYTIARDALRKVLDSEGPGALQLPTQPAEWVVCTQYRLTEEERFGGYCVFDMTFMEFGLDPALAAPTIATANAILQSNADLRQQLQNKMKTPLPPATVPPAAPPPAIPN